MSQNTKSFRLLQSNLGVTSACRQGYVTLLSNLCNKNRGLRLLIYRGTYRGLVKSTHKVFRR